MEKEKLEGVKPLVKSQTVHGNILSILATIGGLAALFMNGVPDPVLLSAVTAAGGAIWGNVLSIFGRVNAEKKIAG